MTAGVVQIIKHQQIRSSHLDKKFLAKTYNGPKLKSGSILNPEVVDEKVHEEPVELIKVLVKNKEAVLCEPIWDGSKDDASVKKDLVLKSNADMKNLLEVLEVPADPSAHIHVKEVSSEEAAFDNIFTNFINQGKLAI